MRNFLFCFSARAQTTLAPGDIAIVGYNVDAGSSFSFILLTPVSSGTTVNFTDFGWCSGVGYDGFQRYEPCGYSTGSETDGAITWTATSPLQCGTQVTISTYPQPTMITSHGTVTGLQAIGATPAYYMMLRDDGDQIFAFQGTIITLSDFAKGAKDAAFEKGAAPITLINGEKLIDLLIENGLGVKKHKFEYFTVDDSYFGTQKDDEVE